MIRNACKAVGSISSTAFDVRFNPDIFSPGKFWVGVDRRLWGSPWGPRCWLVPTLVSPCLLSSCLAQASAVPPTGVRFPESCQEEVRDQKQLLKDAAAFLLSCQIPGLVREVPQGWGAAQGMLLEALVPRLILEACGTFPGVTCLDLLICEAGRAECLPPWCRWGC